MSRELHATVAARLQRVGQRYTGRRRELVDVLAAAERPLTIPEVVGTRAALAQSSVYRNLAVLEEAGVVHRVVVGDEFARYELAEDLTQHHHHLVCVACGAVTDYTLPSRLEKAMARTIEDVVAGTGFRAQSHRLDLVGRCADCG